MGQMTREDKPRTGGYLCYSLSALKTVYLIFVVGLSLELRPNFRFWL